MKGYVYIERRVLVSQRNPQGRIRYYVFAVVDRVKRSEGAFNHLKDAKTRKRILETKIADYSYGRRDYEDLLFEDYFEEWWKGKQLGLKPSAQRGYCGSFERYILPYFGTMRMLAILPQDVQKFVVGLGSLSPRYARTVYAHLRSMMNTAVQHEVIPKSPCRSIDLPRVDNRYLKYLEPYEVGQLVDRVEWPFQALFAVLGMMGVRIGEALALQTKHVDLVGGRLRIEQAWDINTREFHDPKSKAGFRRLEIMPCLTEIMKTHLSQLHNTNRESLLFPSPKHRCQPCSYTTVYGVFKRTLRDLGLQDVTIHSLRHSFASMMLEAGASASTLARYLGHSSPEVTFRVYAHEVVGNLSGSLIHASEMMLSPTGGNVISIADWRRKE